MFKDAFNQVLKLRQREMKIQRYDNLGNLQEWTVNVSPSSFTKMSDIIEDVTIMGREFVVSVENLSKSGFPIPLNRGDIIVDVDMGSNPVIESKELIGIGGDIIGYRVRTK